MPAPVRHFQLLMAISIVLMFVGLYLIFDRYGTQMSRGDQKMLLWFLAGAVVLTIALTAWASWGRSKIARQILLGLYALSLVQAARGLPTFLDDGVGVAVIQVSQFVLQGIALRLLFTDEAKAFYDRPPTVNPV